MKYPEKRYYEKETKSSLEMSKRLKMEVSSQENVTDYVLMPWDDNTTIFINESNGETQPYSRWEFIEKQLRTAKISDVAELVNVIKSYNVVFEKNGEQIKPNWKCLVLHQYFAQLDEYEKKRFFEENGTLSTIRNLALQLKELLPRLKLLKTGFNSSTELQQLQIAGILSHAFFCTFPKTNADCPSINFNTLYEGAYGSVLKNYTEKIKCLIHYFKRIHKKQPSGNLSFHRLNIPDHKFPRWDKTTAGLCSLKVDAEGKIEDQDGFLQMDFANRYVGGGVLGRGCVQEEIRFLISPELIVSRLFTECLADNEALFVVGSERFCRYTGYASTFAFDGDYEDATPFDENRRRKSYLIILDALYFHHSSDQYRESKILRELKKAYVGFKPQTDFKTLPLATGNWGCGAFGGDPQLKTLLQLMASSQACRDVLYLTFGNFVLKNQIEEFYHTLEKKAVNVGMLYRVIRNYNRERKRNQTVFEFVVEAINKIEERKLSSKLIPSTSKETSPFDTEFPKNSSRPEQKIQQEIKKTPSEHLSEMNFDFEALDEEIQKNSKDISLERQHLSVSTKQSFSQGKSETSREHSSILDTMWYENELDSNTNAKEEKTDDNKEHLVHKENSPSLFSDEEMEITYESHEKNPKIESINVFDGSNEFQAIRNTKKAESVVHKAQCKKMIQPKLDCFFKK